MDEELKRKLAPVRNKRHPPQRDFNEEADWGDSLDWKSNSYAFQQLFEALCQRIDWLYRAEHGLRIDQLASRDEMFLWVRGIAAQYQEDEPRYAALGIYVYLLINMKWGLADRARAVLDKRRRGAAELTRELLSR